MEAVLYVIVGLCVLVALVLARRRWPQSPFLQRINLISAYIGFVVILVICAIPGLTDASTNVVLALAFGVGVGLYLFSLFWLSVLSTARRLPSGGIGRQVGFEESWVNYLMGKGVEAQVVELHAPFWKYQSTSKAVRLSGKNIDEIWIVLRSGGDQSRTFKWDTHFRVLLDRPLTMEASKAVAAKTKLIKRDKVANMSGDKITNVEWVGGSIADALNQDTDLQEELLDWAEADMLPAIMIKLAGQSVVTIRVRNSEGLIRVGDEFEIYDRIAKHVRDVVGAY